MARASRAAPSPGPGIPRCPRWSGCAGRGGDVLALRARGGAASDGQGDGQLHRRVRGRRPDRGPGPLPALDPPRLGRRPRPGARRGRASPGGLLGAGQAVPPPVAAVVHALAADPATVWTPALGRETEQGSEVAATTT